MRANPETIVEIRPWFQNGTNGLINTTVWDRSYTSSNTPGFPGVTPLPFRAHEVDIRRRTYGTLRGKRILNGNLSTNYWGPSSRFSVSQPGITYHIGNTERFLNPAESRARSKVIQDIQRVKVNVAQNIAEYRQVRGMFSENVRRITSAYRALRKGDVRGFARSIPLRARHKQSLLRRGPLDIRGAAPAIWLESQYGWLPLVGDVYTGVSTFYQRVESGYTIRAKGSGSAVVTNDDKLFSDVGIITGRDATTKRYRCKYIIDYQVDHTNLANMDDWGITNPTLLAWELLPYSFVVDWFYPIGDWLSQVGYSLGLYFVRGMRVSLCQASTIRNFMPILSSSPLTDVRTVTGQDYFETIRMRRELHNGFPVPVKPKFDPNGLRDKRILNAMSLLSLAFDRRNFKR